MNTAMMRRADRGAGLVEYGLLAGLVSVVSIGAVIGLGNGVKDGFVTVGSEVEMTRLISTADRVIRLGNGDIFPAQSCWSGSVGPDRLQAPADPDAKENDCYEPLGGGDDLDLAASPGRSIALLVEGAGTNTIQLPAGNHVLVPGTGGGRYEITSGAGAGVVDLSNVSLDEVTLQTRDVALWLDAPDLSLRLENVLADAGGAFETFLFADGVRSAADLAVLGVEAQQSDSSDTISGSAWPDVIRPGDGDDTVFLYGGDDRVIYSSGNLIVPGGGGLESGFDRLEIPGFAAADATLSRMGDSLMILLPGGDMIQMFGQFSGEGLFEEVVFFDQTLDYATLSTF